MKAVFSEKGLLDTVHKTKVKSTELYQNNHGTANESLLHVDDPRKLLHSVQQEVAFLYGFLILPVLTVRPGRGREERGTSVQHDANNLLLAKSGVLEL